MGTRVVLIILFLAAAIAAGLSQLPLSYVLNQSGVSSSGLSWARAEGTVWEGRITGLAYGAQPIGTARLHLQPAALLSGRVAYDVQWAGPPGRGSGLLSAGRGGDYSVADLRLEASISALNGAADWVRANGGELRVRADKVRFSKGRCAEAVGTVSTDVLTRAAIAWGQTWPDVSGELSCDAGMLVVPLEGERNGAERVQAVARIGMVEVSSVEASVVNADPQLENALALMGFVYENDAYVFRQSAALSGAG